MTKLNNVEMDVINRLNSLLAAKGYTTDDELLEPFIDNLECDNIHNIYVYLDKNNYIFTPIIPEKSSTSYYITKDSITSKLLVRLENDLKNKICLEFNETGLFEYINSIIHNEYIQLDPSISAKATRELFNTLYKAYTTLAFKDRNGCYVEILYKREVL